MRFKSLTKFLNTERLLVLVAFIIFFIPRIVGLGWDITNYDERYWRPRMRNFVEAIEEGSWKETYQKYHPGVTLMWLSGFAEQSFDLVVEKAVGHSLRFQAKWYPWHHFVSKFPLIFCISILGALCFHLIRRFTNTKFALIFTLLLSLEPFFLGTTRFLHLSGLTSMLMFTSFLLMYTHLHVSRHSKLIMENPKSKKSLRFGALNFVGILSFGFWTFHKWVRRCVCSGAIYFVLSAVLLGLAVLTKMDGAIAGVASIVLLFFNIFYSFNPPKALSQVDYQKHSANGGSVFFGSYRYKIIWKNLKNHRLWKLFISRSVIYGLITFLAFFALWPAMWFDPIGIIRKMISEGIYDTAFSSSGAAMILPWRWLYYFETFFLRSLPTTVILVGLFPLFFFRRLGKRKKWNSNLGNCHSKRQRRISLRCKKFFGLRPQSDEEQPSTFKYRSLRFRRLIKAVLLYLFVVFAFFAFPEKTKDRYLIDFYPPLAVLAAFSLYRILELAAGINFSVIPKMSFRTWFGIGVRNRALKNHENIPFNGTQGRQTLNRVQGGGIVQWFILGLLASFYLLTIYRYHPVYSFYYNDIIGGAAGIEKLNLPIKHRGEYWAQAAQFINQDSVTRYLDEPTGNLNTVVPNREQVPSFKDYFKGKTYADSKFMPDGYHAHYIAMRKEYLDQVPETCELIATFGPRAPWQYDQLYIFSCGRTVDNNYKFKN